MSILKPPRQKASRPVHTAREVLIYLYYRDQSSGIADSAINRETALNLVVNVIPLRIILFFVVLVLFTTPFGSDVVAVFYSQLLLVVPFLSLALVTYVSCRIISETEQNGYSEMSATITKALIGETANDSEPTESETE